MRKFSLLFSLLAILVVASLLPSKIEAAAPATPENVVAKAEPEKGEIKIIWKAAKGANRYAIVYGHSSGNYRFSALNIRANDNPRFIIRSLNPGTKYFFQVWAISADGDPVSKSKEVSLRAPK